jgi:hypothetical protein
MFAAKASRLKSLTVIFAVLLLAIGINFTGPPGIVVEQPIEAVQEDFVRHETACMRAEYRIEVFGTFSRVANVAIDVGGPTAILVAQVPTEAALDPDHRCIPASFEGVEVKQEVLTVSPLN